MHVDLSSPETYFILHTCKILRTNQTTSPSQPTTTATVAVVATLLLVIAVSRTIACPWSFADWLTAHVFVGTEKSGDQRCLMDLMRTDRFLYVKTRSKGTFSTGGLRRIGRTFSVHWFIISIIIPLPVSGGIKRFFCLTSDVCLLCTFSLTREHRD